MDDSSFLRRLEGRYTDPAFIADFGIPTGDQLPQVIDELVKNGADPDVIKELNDSLNAATDVESARRWTIDHFLLPRALELLPPLEAERASRILVGSAFTRTVNAFTVAAPSGDPVILTDEGAALWLRMVALAFFASLTSDSADLPARRRERQASVLGALAMRALARGDDDAFRTAIDHYSEMKDVEELTFISWNLMSQECEVFIVLHEFGHALLGHLDRGVETRRPDINNRDHYAAERNREIEADKFATFHIRGMSENVWASLELFFATMTSCERMSGSPSPMTHPAWEERWAQLHEQLPAPADAPTQLIRDRVAEIVTEWADLAQSDDPLAFPLQLRPSGR